MNTNGPERRRKEEETVGGKRNRGRGRGRLQRGRISIFEQPAISEEHSPLTPALSLGERVPRSLLRARAPLNAEICQFLPLSSRERVPRSLLRARAPLN